MEQEKSSNTILKWLLGILFVFLVFAGYFFLWQKIDIKPSDSSQITAQPTEKNKDEVISYTSRYGFKVEYPKDWRLSERNKGVSFENSLRLSDGYNFNDVQIDYFASILELKGKNQSSELPELLEEIGLVSIKKISVGGLTAYEASTKEGAGSQYYYIFATNNNAIYRFTFSGNIYNASQLTSEQKSILDSFEITDYITLDMKTYIDPKYDFSFSYPSSWFLSEDRWIGFQDILSSVSITNQTGEAYLNPGEAVVNFSVYQGDKLNELVVKYSAEENNEYNESKSEIKQETINDIEMKVVTTNYFRQIEGSPSKHSYYIFTKNGLTYNLSIAAPHDKTESVFNTGLGIIESFKLN